jgi:glycosyltransferase involved in cell wall biosynthesis
VRPGRQPLTPRRRFLVVTEEPLAERMAGPAVRALELARVLGRSGFEVELVSLTGSSRTDPDVRLSHARDLGPALGDTGAVLLQGDVLGLQPWLSQVDIPLVVDAYDPFHLEQLEQARGQGEPRRRAIVRDCVRALNRQLARADLVLAASPRQRDLWLGHLAALGRINPVTYDDDPTLARLVAVVPFGVPDGAPARGPQSVLRGVLPGVAAEDQLLVWGGGIYDWFDPVTLIRAVGRLAGSFPRLRLVFLGTTHPGAGPVGGRAAADARAVAAELGLTGRQVFFRDGWVPYDQRGAFLAEADLGVSTHHLHVETEFSFRTRVLDYLWAGLPVVTTGGDALAEEVRDAAAGAVVPPSDVDALAGVLAGLLADPAMRERCAAASARLAERYRWPLAAAPLLEFAKAPYRAPDLALPAGERALLGLAALQDRPPLPTRLRAAYREGGLPLLGRRLAARLWGGEEGSSWFG